MQESDPRNASRVRQHYSSPERRASLAESILEGKALQKVVEAAKLEDEVLPPVATEGALRAVEREDASSWRGRPIPSLTVPQPKGIQDGFRSVRGRADRPW
jgi:hypothetical protein